MLERMYKKRLKTYAKLGYEIGEASEEEGPGARIIAVDTWRAELSSDFSNACSSAIVSAPYANSKLVESLLPDIAGAVARGVSVRVILKDRRVKNRECCSPALRRRSRTWAARLRFATLR